MLTLAVLTYFSFNLGATVADLLVHKSCDDKPHPADILLELLFAFPLMIVVLIISFFD